MPRTIRMLSVLLLVGGLFLTACSPEATRSRGGGPGGDIGNRPAVVDLHGRTDPFFETPRFTEGTAR